MDRDKKHVIPRRAYGRKRREFFHNEEREARIKEQEQADVLKAEKEKEQAKNNEERVKDNLRKARIEKITHDEKKTSKKLYKVNSSDKTTVEVNNDSNSQDSSAEKQKSNEQMRIQQDLYKQQANDIQREKAQQQDKDIKESEENVETSEGESKPRHQYTKKRDWTEGVTQFVSREWAKILIVLGALLILILLFSIFKNVNGSHTTGAIGDDQSTSQKSMTETMKHANAATKSVVAVENNQETTPETVQDAEQQGQVQNESGSGVVYKKVDGLLYILTNAHVVGNKKVHTLTYGHNKTVEGKVIGQDKWSDVAVMTVKASKVDEKQLKPLKQGDSEKLILGEPVLVVGNPLGLDFRNTIGQGIISGIDRNVPIDIDKDGEYDTLVRAFQVDAPINPGDSGGAVIDRDGKLIGIASLKISMPNVEGMGFAIPMNDAIKIADKLQKDGRINYTNLRMELKDVASLSESERSSYRINDNVKEGAVVDQITKNSAASLAGLETGDVIVEVDGKPTKDKLVYRQKMFQHLDKDKPVKFKVLRDGEVKHISVDL